MVYSSSYVLKSKLKSDTRDVHIGANWKKFVPFDVHLFRLVYHLLFMSRSDYNTLPYSSVENNSPLSFLFVFSFFRYLSRSKSRSSLSWLVFGLINQCHVLLPFQFKKSHEVHLLQLIASRNDGLITLNIRKNHV